MYELFYALFVIFILGLAYYKILRPLGVRIPGLPRFGKGRSGSIVEAGLCPFCKSEDIFYSAKRSIYYCSKCNDGKMGFTTPIRPDKVPRQGEASSNPVMVKPLSEEEFTAIMNYVPDEFLSQAAAFLKGTDSSRQWLELFSYKYPKWYRDFMNTFMRVTGKAKQ